MAKETSKEKLQSLTHTLTAYKIDDKSESFLAPPTGADQTNTIKMPLHRFIPASRVTPILRKHRANCILRPKAGVPESWSATSKSVAFNQTIDHIRLFDYTECPYRVAEQGTTTKCDDFSDLAEDTQPSTFVFRWRIREKSDLTKEPDLSMSNPVNLEQISLTKDNSDVNIVVRALNLAFHKEVMIHYTMDNWNTVSELAAEYVPSSLEPGRVDRFRAHISLPDAATARFRKLVFCVRYRVQGKEYWGNNNGSNYYAEIQKKSVKIRKGNLRRSRQGSEERSYGRSVRTLWAPKVAKSSSAKAAEAAQQQHMRPFAAQIPTHQNAPVDSKEYREMLDKYCYFEPRMVTPV